MKVALLSVVLMENLLLQDCPSLRAAEAGVRLQVVWFGDGIHHSEK